MLRFEVQRALSNGLSLRSGALSVAIMAVAVATRAIMQQTLPGTSPFITLYPAVALVGLLYGPWAGGIAALVGAATAVFFWIPPQLSFEISDVSDCVSVALFVSASAIVLWVAAATRAQLTAASVAKHTRELGLAAGGVGTWEINLRTREISASDTAYRLHGLAEGTRQTAVEDWLRGVHPDDLAVARTVLQTAVAEGTLAFYTYRISVAPDELRWITARGRVVSVGGDPLLLCALVDITDQVRVQDELAAERERLRLALEAGALAVWDYDLATGNATVDARYAKNMGFGPDVTSLTREKIGERMHPADRSRVVAEHEALVASGSDYHIEYRIIPPSGDIRWQVSQGIKIKGNTPSDPGRMVGIIQDITDRKLREDELRELASMREVLVREADHRIKNSLQLVSSLLTVQLRGLEDPGAKEALRGAITRVGAIASSHLALQGSTDLKQIDLAVMLKELCAHMTKLHPAIDIVCRPSNALMLDADRAIPLGLAVSELLTNSMRHAFPDRESGKVAVDASKDSSHLIVCVSDDGVGMNVEPGVAGLGSKIIRSLTSRVGATIQVGSSPQVGTIVTLRLPLQEKQRAPGCLIPVR
jgi:two-component sensor histidine kinase/PAS domain-containing protein